MPRLGLIAQQSPIAEGYTWLGRRLVAFDLERECKAGTNLVARASVDPRIAIRGIEAEIFFDLPDRADERRTGFRLQPCLVVKKLGHRTNFPGRGSLEDDVEEHLAMLLAGQVGLDVEMRGAPVPPLRHDAGPTEPDSGLGIDAGQQRPEFRRDADAGLARGDTRLNHVFQESARGGESARAAGRKRGLDLALQNHFPALGNPEIEDASRA